MIAGSSWNVGHDGPFFSSYGIEKAGFTAIWRTGDDHLYAIFETLDRGAIKPRLQLACEDRTIARQCRLGLSILLVIIDRSLSLGREHEQPRLPFGHLL